MSAGDKYIDSQSKVHLSTKQLIRSLIVEDANGRPVLKNGVAQIVLPPPPYLVLARDGSVANSITGLDYEQGSGPSSSSVFLQIMAAGLSPATGTITVTPSSNLEFSNNSGSTWHSTPQNFAYSGSHVSTGLVYLVRLKSGLSPNSYNETLTISGQVGINVSSFVCSISGTVSAATPVITIADDTPLLFDDTAVSGESSEKNFSVSAIYLTSDLVITPPTGFKISLTSGSGFTTSPINISHVSGSVSPTTIYVIFNPSSDINYSSSIDCSSTGATTKSIDVSGDGIYFINATGGTITEYSVYRVHDFTSSGNFEVLRLATHSIDNDIEYLLLGGAAGAGSGNGGTGGGGGGAGGWKTGSFAAALGILPAVIGGGGSGSTNTLDGTDGSNSTFNGITANGGGGGATQRSNLGPGKNGASGGGASYGSAGGTGIAGQGNNGGSSVTALNARGGGGGGGAGAAGQNGTSTKAGDGGDGLSSSITGSAVYYAAGGGGGFALTTTAQGLGGNGGGGNGASTSGGSGFNGTANKGSGGGGGSLATTGNGGNGGSGRLLIRYKIK